MICRVAFHDSSSEPITSEAATTFRAWMKSMPGFVAGWHGADAAGRAVSFTVWESEEHLNALRDKIPPGKAGGLRPVQMELFTTVVEF